MNRLKAVGIAVDQLLNAVLGGWPDETFSSRCWRWQTSGTRTWPRKLVDGLLFFDPDHCERSYHSEARRLQFPPELRQEGMP